MTVSSRIASWFRLGLACAPALCLASAALAQSVCLPLPRLLTTMPMGAMAGSQVEITVSGENVEDAGDLYFTHPGLTATRKLSANGQPGAATTATPSRNRPSIFAPGRMR